MITPKNAGRPLSLWRTLLLLILSGVCALAQEVITQSEPDDSIGTANATGFTPGSRGVKVAYGHTGDGP